MAHFTAIWRTLLRYGALYCDMAHFTAIWRTLLRYGALYCDMAHWGILYNITIYPIIAHS